MSPTNRTETGDGDGDLPADIDDSLRGEIVQQILHIVGDLYDRDVAEIIGYTSGLLRDAGLKDDVPDSVNNQIRNAFNHIGRAHKALNSVKAAENIRDAKRHLYVAKCLSLCSAIETVCDGVGETLFYIRYKQGTADSEFLDFREVAKNYGTEKRKIILKIDLSQRNNDVVLQAFPMQAGVSNSFEKLLADYLTLMTQIRDKYDVPSQAEIRKSNRKMRLTVGLRAFVGGFLGGFSIGGILASLVASAIFYYLTSKGYFAGK